MKRIIILFPIAALAAFCLLQACKKEDKYPSRVVTISYPVVTLNGAADTTINRGSSWVDPGATWQDTVTGESGNITLSVNTTVDSAYYLVYTATNKNGFQTTLFRGLGVTDMGDGIDISGTYYDTFGGTDNVTKVSRALFYNPSVDAQGNPGVMVIKSDSTLSVATIVVANLTGAGVPETFAQDTIGYQPSISFRYTPSVLNVPPGSGSYLGLPIGVQVIFQHQRFGH